jgi:hypothetical protein
VLDTSIGLSLKKIVKATLAIQRNEIIKATDVGVPDENLWNCSASGTLNHGCMFGAVLVDFDFIYLKRPLSTQQCFGTLAKRALGCAVHSY